jgi:DNA-binding LacI/PurR family transcriptional regulator
MEGPLNNVTIQRSRSGREQIQEQVRDLILSGKLAPGSKLPSTHELARRWNTHAPTVHAALRPLVREGLISRAHRTGTFVRKREEKLTCVGIYYAEDYLTTDTIRVHAAIHAALKEQLNEMGIRTSVWIDPRPLAEQDQPWPELIRAVERREVQALITSTTDWPHLNWHNRLPIPTAHHTSASIPNRVLYDAGQFWDLSLRALAKQGCRSIGLIAKINPDHPEHLNKFVAVAGELNLQLRDEWMLTPRPDKPWGRRPTEHKGYEKFGEFWQLPERPDGLVVFPDAIAVGVVCGLIEKRVQVPADLKVVLHKDADVEMFCPVPVTFVTSRARDMARALIEQILKQTRGELCEPIILRYACAESVDAGLPGNQK